ncbi:MAG: hypothetical protein OXT67_02100 [Zetaproteobacteria bacterium]|nr:hypothetical protein [Zetaproteobacteria bacterium]
MANKNEPFDESLICDFPRANKKLNISVRQYNLTNETQGAHKTSQCSKISPHGIEFHCPEDYELGTLLKIDVSLPDYWRLKKKYVDYSRIDSPDQFKILARVIKMESVGKRSRKKKIIAKTVNIDEVDEIVLRTFLKDGK